MVKEGLLIGSCSLLSGSPDPLSHHEADSNPACLLLHQAWVVFLFPPRELLNLGFPGLGYPNLTVEFSHSVFLLLLSIPLIRKLYCSMEFYTTIRKDKVMNFAAIWKDLENIMLSEASQRRETHTGRALSGAG